MLRWLVRWLAVGAAGALAAGGCGSSTINGSSAGAQISADLAKRFGVPPPAVRCPARVPPRPGQRFTCTTALDAQPVTVDAVVIDTSGRFESSLGAAVLVVATAEDDLAAAVGRRLGRPATVSCPTGHRLLVEKPGQTFTCTATAGGVRHSLTVTVTDTSGHVTYTLDA